MSGGLIRRSDRVIYPLGSSLVLSFDPENPFHRQTFLTGHFNPISCLDLSQSGRFAATGERGGVNRVKVSVMVWDLGSNSKERLFGAYRVHRAEVVAVKVSPGDRFVVSVGGQDDDGAVIVWDINEKAPLCGKLIRDDYRM